MPIIIPDRNSAPVFFPKSEYNIVKYLDLTKFISLLQNKSLFFCRLDKLEDQFEGITSKPNFEQRVKWYKHTRDVDKYFSVELTDEAILESVKKMYESEKRKKSINCINCWNKYDGESVALWKIYSNFGNGIMIKSKISNLIKSLSESKEEINLSEIHYLDYDTEVMPDGNAMYPLIHKQKAYSYENEIRLIHQVNHTAWQYDWSKEKINEGIFINADINELIDEIIIGPFSPKWMTGLVQDISTKYSLEKPITHSKLSSI